MKSTRPKSRQPAGSRELKALLNENKAPSASAVTKMPGPALKQSRFGRTIRTRVELKPATKREGRGHGGFDLLASGEDAKSIIAVARKLPLTDKNNSATTSQIETKNNTKTPNNSLFFPDSKIAVGTKAETNSFSSPHRRLLDKWQKRGGFVDPNGPFDIKERSPGGHAVRVQKQTPNKTEFVRAFKVFLKIPVNEKSETLEIQLYQTRTSAESNSKDFKIPKETVLKKIREHMRRPLSTEIVVDTQVDSSSLDHDQKRIYADKFPATGIAHVSGLNTACHHSHLVQHSVAQISGVTILDQKQIDAGIQADEWPTLVAPKNHNAMRLASPLEHPLIKSILKAMKSIGFKSKVTTRSDKNGPLGILETETSTVYLPGGGEVTVVFSPHNGVRPSANLRPFGEDMLRLTLFSPPHKNRKKNQLTTTSTVTTQTTPKPRKSRS